MERIKKGDIVARKSYRYDVFFLVENIIKTINGSTIAVLKGISARILADAYIEDLTIISKDKINDSLRNWENKINNRIEIMLKCNKTRGINKERNDVYSGNLGKILHLDGDKFYSEKSLKYYRKMGLNAIVKNVLESKQPIIVKDFINKYNPDVLVLTGHDAMIKKGTKYGELSNYRNSKYFVESVKEARKIKKNGNTLAIFAGACQSFFEAIISVGADFASSPGRILIDFMDPLIVAEKIATTEKMKFVSINDIVGELRDGKEGIGGVGVMGKKR